MSEASSTDPRMREPPHCSTCSCGVLSEFHNLDDLAEIERLSAENHRLNLKCSALALLHYGPAPDVDAKRQPDTVCDTKCFDWPRCECGRRLP
jgi:hypothetical protein